MDKKTLKKLIKEEIQKILKEETTGNIWDSYQMVIFDVLPDAKTIENLITQALNSDLVSPESKKLWGYTSIKNYAEDLQIPWTFQKTPTRSLYIDPKYNGLHPTTNHLSVLRKFPSITPIKYSEIAQ